MIEKVIASILDAEKEAASIIADGMKEYKEIISSAEIKADKDKKELIANLKVSQDTQFAEAEAKAQANYQQAIEDGKADAKNMQAESMQKTDKAVEFIIRKVI